MCSNMDRCITRIMQKARPKAAITFTKRGVFSACLTRQRFEGAPSGANYRLDILNVTSFLIIVITRLVIPLLLSLSRSSSQSFAAPAIPHRLRQVRATHRSPRSSPEKGTQNDSRYIHLAIPGELATSTLLGNAPDPKILI